MKVASLGLDIAAGKYKYTTECFQKLAEKYKPKKTSPYFIEIISHLSGADVIAYSKERKIDLIINDLDLIEKRLSKAGEEEKKLLVKLQTALEQNKLLAEVLSPEEKERVRDLNLLSLRPCVEIEKGEDEKGVIAQIFEQSGFLLFYTAGPKEVHAWLLRRGENILKAAAKIHSDLARGFIKGEVINCAELLKVFNMAEARAKGLVKSVDRDYVVEDGDVIEIKFSV